MRSADQNKQQSNIYYFYGVHCRYFYRATRMYSADYAVARCLSVRPSLRHTPVLCLNGYTCPHSFLPSGSPTTLVFPYQTGWQYFDGNPLTHGGVECKGAYKKITIFDQYNALSRNRCRIKPQLLWKGDRKPHPSFRMVPV